MTAEKKSARKNDQENSETYSRSGSVQDITSILDDYIADTELGKKLKKFSIFNHWDEIVGKEISRKTKPQKLFKGILYISVSDPGWANELSMISQQLIQKINNFTGQDTVDQLRFKMMQ